jgi:toxin FitB
MSLPMKYLLDTNVISELVAKQPNQQVVAWVDSLDPNFVYLSTITIGELSKGIEKLPQSKRKAELTDWLHHRLLVRFSDHIFGLDAATMLRWGQLTARLETVGRTLPAMDSLIAAIALHYECILATRNERDFKDTGVTILNPWQ